MVSPGAAAAGPPPQSACHLCLPSHERSRRVSLSEFKGTLYVAVREYYEKDAQMLPGQKGLNMTSPQWAACVAGAPSISAILQQEGLMPPA